MAKLYYVVYPNKFPDYWEFILSRTYGTCAEILLLGILLVLLAIGAYLLYHRAGAERRILAAATCIMALLAAVQLGIHLWGTVLAFHILRLAIQGEVWPTSPRAVAISILYSDLYAVEDFLLVTNNLVADSLFTYRCFVIWERNLRVVILPMIMVFATTLLGYLCAYRDDYARSSQYIDFRIAFLMSVVTNIVLMALTAGRIWWIRRDASVLADCASVRRYNMVIAIILESGAIYCLSVIIYVTIVSILNPGNFSPLIDIFRGVVPQIMNIAPALIIVRVGLGYNGSGSEQQQSESAGSRPAAANGDPDPMLLRVMDISARRRNSNAAVADPERQV